MTFHREQQLQALGVSPYTNSPSRTTPLILAKFYMTKSRCGGDRMYFLIITRHFSDFSQGLIEEKDIWNDVLMLGVFRCRPQDEP